MKKILKFFSEAGKERLLLGIGEVDVQILKTKSETLSTIESVSKSLAMINVNVSEVVFRKFLKFFNLTRSEINIAKEDECFD